MTAPKKPGIPSVSGVKDQATSKVLSGLKESVEIITGSRSGVQPLSPLASGATIAAILNAINALTGRLNHDGVVSSVPTTAVPATQYLNGAGGFSTPPTGSTAKYKVGQFTRNVATASGNAAVTGVGFKPKVVIFLSSINGGTGNSVGFDDGTTAVLQLIFNSGGVANYSINGASSIFAINDVTITNFNAAAIFSLDADGFTIAWTKTGAPTGTASMFYMAIG